jgi:pectate lyase
MRTPWRLWSQKNNYRNGRFLPDAVTRIYAFGLAPWARSFAMVVFVLPFPAIAGLPAFPGAEGSGALAKGGRGGAVCEVTNLNDSGPGSLRACAEDMSGPRTVIFRVSGTIVLKSGIRIRNPYITIAGQTAPGGGIQVTGKEPGSVPWCDPARENNCAEADLGEPLIQIGTHDVVIRYLRLRPGYTGPSARGDTTGIRISTAYGRSIYNVIVDHVSINWWGGNAVTVWDNPGTGPARRLRDISVQNSLFAENVYEMRFGINVGSSPADMNEPSGEAGTDMGDIDFHRNLLSTTFARFPLVGMFRGNARFTNNIFYNTQGHMSGVRSYNPPRHETHVDFVGNRYDLGPLRPKSSSRVLYPITIERNDSYPAKVHVAGNWSDVVGYDNYNMITTSSSASSSQTPDNPAPDIYRRLAPNPRPSIAITSVDVDVLEDHILPKIGASQRLDCEGNWVFNRDVADIRIVEEGYKKRAQTFLLSHEDQVGGFPRLDKGAPCSDTSADGVPDAWLVRNGLDPRDSAGSRLHESGYTFLELYLNGMQVDAQPQVAPAAAPSGVRVQ